MYYADPPLPLCHSVVATPYHRAIGAALRNPATMTWLAIALVFFQIVDGILTAIGMSRFGIGMEGNPALRAGMGALGVVPTLAIAKTVAISIIIWLRLVGEKVAWVGEALALIALTYLSAAVVPWGIIILQS